MSYCCGASKIGYIGRLRQEGILIYAVPLLYCPVCYDVEVHPAVLDEFALVLEFAMEDEADEVIFCAEITPDMIEEWSEDCISFEKDGDLYKVFQGQIDHALDLLSLSRSMEDKSWSDELKHRLKVLSYRIKCLEEYKESSSLFK